MRIAIDVGSARVGVARSDPDGILAVPVSTVARDVPALEVRGVVAEWEAKVVYVGLPLTLRGEDGLAAVAARAFADQLATQVGCPVHLVDERLSTVEAQRALRDAGRGSRDSRSVIDQAAAVLILEQALAAERATGTRAGERVTF